MTAKAVTAHCIILHLVELSRNTMGSRNTGAPVAVCGSSVVASLSVDSRIRWRLSFKRISGYGFSNFVVELWVVVRRYFVPKHLPMSKRSFRQYFAVMLWKWDQMGSSPSRNYAKPLNYLSFDDPFLTAPRHSEYFLRRIFRRRDKVVECNTVIVDFTI